MQILPIRLTLVLLAIGFALPFSSAFAQQELEFREPVQADGQLAWKFREGLVIKTEMNQATEIAMNLAGRDFTTKTKAVNELTLTVQSVDADGVATVSNVIDRMYVGTESPGVAFEFDSADEEGEGQVGPAVQIGETLRPLIGAEMSQKMSPNGKIFDVEIPDGVLNGIQNANPQMGKAFSEKTMEDMATKSSLVFPDAAPAVGTSWTADETMDMGLMKLTTSTEYVYKGVAEVDGKPYHVIVGDLTMSFPEGAEGPQIEVSDQDSSIIYYFDGNAGRLFRTDLSQDVKMQVSQGPQEINQNLKQTMTMVMTAVEE